MRFFLSWFFPALLSASLLTQSEDGLLTDPAPVRLGPAQVYLPNGKETKYYPDGKEAASGLMVDGKRQGLWNLKLQDGKRQEITYKAGLKNGPCKSFDAKGRLTGVQHYKADLLCGPCQAFDEAGSVVFEANYKDGALHGPSVQYWQAGKPLSRGQYLQGEPYGKWQWLAADGSILHEEDLAAKGSFYIYDFAAGSLQLQKMSPYEKGRKNGVEKVYQNGSLVAELSYKEGLLDGAYKAYYPEGELAQEGSYAAGIPAGKLLAYYPDGKVARQTTFSENGRAATCESYFSSGTVSNRTELFDGTKQGTERTYDESGTLRIEDPLVKGKRQGLYQEWDKDGKLVQKSTWFGGKRHGSFERFYANGKLAAKTNYSCDVLDGNCLQYYEDGTLQLQGSYLSGLEDGKWQSFYPDGALQTEALFIAGKQHSLVQKFPAEAGGHIALEQKFDSEGRLHGEERMWFAKVGFSKGLLQSVRHFDAGVLHGPCQTFHDDLTGQGAICADSRNYVRGRVEGAVVKCDYEGRRISVENYQANVQEGMQSYFFSSGALRCEGTATAGARSGVWKWFDGKEETLAAVDYSLSAAYDFLYAENGTLLRRTELQDQLRDGLEQCYTQEGKLEKTCQYKDDLLNGSCTTYYAKEGKERLTSTYVYDQLSGPVRAYSSPNLTVKENASKPIQDISYTWGLENGPSRILAEDGTTLLGEGTFKEGTKDGKWQERASPQSSLETIHYDCGVKDAW